MKYIYLFLLIIIPGYVLAQKDTAEQPRTSTLTAFLKGSNWEFQNRNQFMATINNGALKDDYAFGTSVAAGFTTKPVFGFQFGISGSFIFNVVSSDIDQLDSLAMNPNRYELGMFDLDHPSQKSDLNKLEKAFIKYNFSKNSAVSFGRIGLSTPFINPQDGRLRPTAQQGIWAEINELKKFSFSGGWLSAMSPRSIIGWYTVAESFGLYPMGLNVDGKRADYKNNITSGGVGLLNIVYRPVTPLRLSFWNTMIENVLNTAMLECTGQKAIRNYNFYAGLMLVRQDAINNGGNADPAKTYVSKGARSNIFSAQLGCKGKRLNSCINYTRITKDGRFLMPREWGRDPFYTFMPRERNEGFGDVHAMMAKCMYSNRSGRFTSSLSYGYYDLPDEKDFRLNKYGQPAYHQVNAETGYAFKGFFKGVNFRTLFAWKINAGNLYDNPRYEYNKVNMLNCNVVLEYKL